MIYPRLIASLLYGRGRLIEQLQSSSRNSTRTSSLCWCVRVGIDGEIEADLEVPRDEPTGHFDRESHAYGLWSLSCPTMPVLNEAQRMRNPIALLIFGRIMLILVLNAMNRERDLSW